MSTSTRRRRADEDSGSATLQIVILWPALALITLTFVQLCLIGFANGIAQAAADQGSRQASFYGSSPSAGIARARQVITETGNTALLDVQVSSAGSTPEQVTITVIGTVPSLVPGLTAHITSTVTTAVERQTSGEQW